MQGLVITCLGFLTLLRANGSRRIILIRITTCLCRSRRSRPILLEKAQDVLNQTVIVSDVNGTVVEVADSVDPASKESQTLVHVTSEGQFEIQGTLTEYDIPNISVGQKVKITSKVYPDKTWTGKVSYVSNYPKQNASQSAVTGTNRESSSLVTSRDTLKPCLSLPIGLVS